MKYWVYKDSRILGPLDREGVGRLPGVGAGTLVCSGDIVATSETDWHSLSDIPELAEFAAKQKNAWSADEPPTTVGLLEQLNISSTKIVDDSIPGLAEDLFQERAFKQSFSEILPRSAEARAQQAAAPPPPKSDPIARQLEALNRRIQELEASHSELNRRLAEKEAALESRLAFNKPETASAAAPVAAAPQTFTPPPAPIPTPAPTSIPTPAPAPAPLAKIIPQEIPAPVNKSTFDAPRASGPAAPPPIAAPAASVPIPAVPEASAPAAEPEIEILSPDTPEEEAEITPAPMETVPAEVPAPEPEPPVLDLSAPPTPPAFEPPSMEPNQDPVVEAVAITAEEPPITLAPPAPPVMAGEAPPARPAAQLFEIKQLRIVPTIKSFRIVDHNDDAKPIVSAVATTPAPAPIPTPEILPRDAAPPPPAMPARTVPDRTEESTLPATLPDASDTFPTMERTEPIGPAIPSPSASTPLPPAPELQIGPAMSAMMPGESLPTTSSGPLGGSIKPAPPPISIPIPPLATPAAVEARLSAKPLPAQGASMPTRRAGRTFLLFGAVGVIILAVVGSLFLRQPKDLKQMTRLDDGRSPIGTETTEESSAGAANSAQPAGQPGAQTPAANAAASHVDEAIENVKTFPLDGGRGTVAGWLQYSYMGSPNAGQETWTGSQTAATTYLIEYHFKSTSPGVTDAHYVFETDLAKGFVVGKNVAAQNMLAGSAPAKPAAPAKSKKRKSARRKKSS